ncbi:substrate-binding domain-containing protein [Faecalispora jeddahensis]|jgi:AI-2 transport system substrate-binding protein|uniref:substrate-binding domain-containing protein n=1 Tax=Faecalispora jeddahensis TaxID=1414721 RepID=UPI0004BC44F1|nr:substrate-binding domain-containing protein [Faecalispora jeddahensis]
MKKVLAFVLAAAMASLPLVGCGSSEKPAASSGAPASQAASTADSGTKSVEGKTVVFIPKLTGNAFFESANAGAQKYSKDWGFTVSYQGSPSAAVADQVQVVNNAIASGADAICISSVDATGLDSVLKKAKDAGITVATWDSDVSSDARTLMVSQGTPDILGKMLVDMGADSLTKRGKDVKKDAIKYCWHYSQATVADQNSWQVAGEAYIKENYPNWENVAPSNYYSEQDAEKAVSIGSSILEAHKDIDLIICNDSTALPGQLKAAQNKGLTKDKVTITGFASPNSIRDYAKANVIEQWGLWDCGIQGAMGCYLAAYLAAGNTVKVGDTIDIPNIGKVEVQPNDSLVSGAKTGDTDNGVVLLPERVVFTTANVDNYNF